MKKKFRLQLIIGLVLALVVTSGLYAFTYLSATATMDVTVAGAEIATAELSAAQPNWNSILQTETGTEILRPSATGIYSQCDDVGDSPNYACVDEEMRLWRETDLSSSPFIRRLEVPQGGKHRPISKSIV